MEVEHELTSDFGLAVPKKRFAPRLRRVAAATPRPESKLRIVPPPSPDEESGSNVLGDVEIPTPQEAAPAPKAVPPKPQASEVDGKDKKKPTEIFYRDGAKYVCTVCHTKHFTKVEVTKCYAGH